MEYDRTKTKVKTTEALGRDVECKAYAQGYYDAFEDSSEK
jgi:hypothetical protein